MLGSFFVYFTVILHLSLAPFFIDCNDGFSFFQSSDYALFIDFDNLFVFDTESQDLIIRRFVAQTNAYLFALFDDQFFPFKTDAWFQEYRRGIRSVC